MKYIPSALAGQFSGSAGSSVASHNSAGSYFRIKVTPTNPRSARQTVVRGLTSTLAAAWRALTAAQRNGWNLLGTSMERTDGLGHLYNLSGFQAYMSVNRNLQTVGSSTVSDAPTFTTPASIASVTVTATSV